eukprot:PhF_6_TR15064/c0_g1_i1/m.23672
MRRVRDYTPYCGLSWEPHAEHPTAKGIVDTFHLQYTFTQKTDWFKSPTGFEAHLADNSDLLIVNYGQWPAQKGMPYDEYEVTVRQIVSQIVHRRLTSSTKRNGAVDQPVLWFGMLPIVSKAPSAAEYKKRIKHLLRTNAQLDVYNTIAANVVAQLGRGVVKYVDVFSVGLAKHDAMVDGTHYDNSFMSDVMATILR